MNSIHEGIKVNLVQHINVLTPALLIIIKKS